MNNPMVRAMIYVRGNAAFACLESSELNRVVVLFDLKGNHPNSHEGVEITFSACVKAFRSLQARNPNFHIVAGTKVPE